MYIKLLYGHFVMQSLSRQPQSIQSNARKEDIRSWFKLETNTPWLRKWLWYHLLLLMTCTRMCKRQIAIIKKYSAVDLKIKSGCIKYTITWQNSLEKDKWSTVKDRHFFIYRNKFTFISESSYLKTKRIKSSTHKKKML